MLAIMFLSVKNAFVHTPPFIQNSLIQEDHRSQNAVMCCHLHWPDTNSVLMTSVAIAGDSCDSMDAGSTVFSVCRGHQTIGCRVPGVFVRSPGEGAWHDAQAAAVHQPALQLHAAIPAGCHSKLLLPQS